VDGKRCRELREARGLTQEQLAAQISTIYRRGTRPSTLAHIELGTRQPSAGLFDALCTTLGVARESLLCDRHEDQVA